MKLFAVTLLGLIAAACANPVMIHDNNIGDIITLTIDGTIELNSEINKQMVNVLVALLNQQAVLVAVDAAELAADDYAASPAHATPAEGHQEFKLTPEMVERFKSFLTGKAPDA